MSRRVDLFGFPLDIGVTEADVLGQMRERNMTLTYLNPLAWYVVRAFPDYPSDLARFDFVVCDGVGIQKAAARVYGAATPILTPDYSGIASGYLRLGAKRGCSLCLVGGRPGVAETAARAIRAQFPGFSSVTPFSGYGTAPDDATTFALKNEPAMVLAGMGMGRQEEWLQRLQSLGWQGVGICVGGFLDKLACPELSYPAWSERIGMRFLGRLVQEPGRMSKRYALEYQPFMRHYLKSFLRSGSTEGEGME